MNLIESTIDKDGNLIEFRKIKIESMDDINLSYNINMIKKLKPTYGDMIRHIDWFSFAIKGRVKICMRTIKIRDLSILGEVWIYDIDHENSIDIRREIALKNLMENTNRNVNI